MSKRQKILVGCEESQEVTKALRELGNEAFSCDLQKCSGDHPEWHLQMDIFEAIKGGVLLLESGDCVIIDRWDMAIFFPPCTDLTKSGARHFEQKRKDGRQKKSIKFFLELAYCEIPKIAIENPVGIMSNEFRKPDQIVQPFWFGDSYQKATCLWLKDLPKLEPTQMVEPVFIEYNSKKTKTGKSKYSYMGKVPTTGNNEAARRLRSKTPNGLAKAMADQWTKHFADLEDVTLLNMWNILQSV